MFREDTKKNRAEWPQRLVFTGVTGKPPRPRLATGILSELSSSLAVTLTIPLSGLAGEDARRFARPIGFLLALEGRGGYSGVHGPFDTLEDTLGTIATFAIFLALIFVPMYVIHKRYGKILHWYSPYHFIRRLFDPYRDEFGPHFAHGERGRVEYQMVYGFFLEGLIMHKRDEKEITPKLRALLVNRSKADPKDQEETLAIKIISFTNHRPRRNTKTGRG
jgi:hypothetical protein